MAAKPLTTEAIALTEKKMDMTLDDIIRMSKTKTTKTKKQRVPNKNPKVQTNGAQEKSAKVRRFMDSRSSLRQGALAQKRSSFNGNRFPLATEAARKAAVAPLRNRAFNQSRRPDLNKLRAGGAQVQRKATYGNFIVKPKLQMNGGGQKQRPQTLDSMFANLKEQRMRAQQQQQQQGYHNNNEGRRNGGAGGGGFGFQQQRQQRGRGGGRFGN